MNKLEMLQKLILQTYKLSTHGITLDVVAGADIDGPEVDDELQNIMELSENISRLAKDIMGMD
jgi:hypothetical protein